MRADGDWLGMGERTVMPPSEARSFLEVRAPDWADERHTMVAYALSLGCTQREAAKAGGVDKSTVARWLHGRDWSDEFRAYVDELTFRSGLARRAERLRYAKKMAEKRFDSELKEPSKRHTALDWLRFVGELAGDEGGRPQSGIVAFINQLFQVNVAGGAPPAVSDVVEGEVRELPDGGKADNG